MAEKNRKISGYHHIFYHTGGGCGVGPCKGINDGFACDDDYQCLNCGLEIKLLSKPEGHFQVPTFFEGRDECVDNEESLEKEGK